MKPIKTLKLNDKEIVKYFKEIDALQEDINKIREVLEAKDKEFGVLINKADRARDKVRPMLADKIKEIYELGEFEMVGSMKLVGEEVEVPIIDRVEQFKESLREQIKKAKEEAKEKTKEKENDNKKETKKGN